MKIKNPFFNKAIDYIKNHWLKALLWFITGGVLTIYAIWKLITSGPDVEIKPDYAAFEYSKDQDGMYYNCTMEFAIVNSGDKAYFPQGYRLIAVYEDTTIVFEPLSLPDSTNVEDLGDFRIDVKPEKNLTKVEKIEPDDIAFGFIEFVSKIDTTKLNFNVIDYKYMQIEIRDLNENYVRSEKMTNKDYSIKNESHPKSGVEWRKSNP